MKHHVYLTLSNTIIMLKGCPAGLQLTQREKLFFHRKVKLKGVFALVSSLHIYCAGIYFHNYVKRMYFNIAIHRADIRDRLTSDAHIFHFQQNIPASLTL